jgi:rubrerythrin
MDELDAEEDRLNPSVEDDDINRLEWKHERKENEQEEMDIYICKVCGRILEVVNQRLKNIMMKKSRKVISIHL